MAYFDKDNFRKEAEAANYSKEAIDAYIAKIDAQDAAEKHQAITKILAPAAAASAAVAQPIAAPPAPAPAPLAAAPALPAITSKTTPADLFNMRRPGSTVERLGGMVNEAGTAAATTGQNATQSSLDYARDTLANNPDLPAEVLLPLGLGYGVKKAADAGLFSDLGAKIAAKFGPAQQPPFVGGSGPRNTAAPIQDWGIHDEPPLFAPAAAPEVTAAPAAAPSRNLTIEEAQARMAGVTPAAKPETMPAQAAWAPPAAEVINKPSMLSSGTTIGTAPARPVTPTPPAALASTETAATPPTEAATPKKRGPAPAEPVGNYPKKTTFKTAAEIPEGFVFRPDVGNLDRSMYNILGPEHRQQAKEFLTGGQMFGHSADVNADVSKLTNQYFQRLQSEVPETILGRDARKLQNVPSDFGVYGGKGGFGKAAKVAGITGTLFAAADLANAATNAAQGKYGEAGGQAAEVGMNFMPPALQALTYAKGAGEGEDTELARQRRMTEYVKRAGRGVAQGYDPRKLIGVAPPAR